jgi:hypothetical protein
MSGKSKERTKELHVPLISVNVDDVDPLQSEVRSIRQSVNELKKVAWQIKHGFFRFEGREAAKL